MAFISPEDRQTLQTLFTQELQDEVNITYFTQRESVLIVPGQECSYCKETRELLEELTDISDKLHLTVKDFVRDEQEAQSLGITRIPAFILQGHTKGAVRYFGIPASRLDVAQSALLAGLVQSPTTYDPLRDPALLVLGQKPIGAQRKGDLVLTPDLHAEKGSRRYADDRELVTVEANSAAESSWVAAELASPE